MGLVGGPLAFYTGEQLEAVSNPIIVLFTEKPIAHAGIPIGRKTYLVDMAGGTKRTDDVAVSNTVIGVLLLAPNGKSWSSRSLFGSAPRALW